MKSDRTGFPLPENGVTSIERNPVVLIGIKRSSVNSVFYKIVYRIQK